MLNEGLLYARCFRQTCRQLDGKCMTLCNLVLMLFPPFDVDDAYAILSSPQHDVPCPALPFPCAKSTSLITTVTNGVQIC
jgi:hypothetical protein